MLEVGIHDAKNTSLCNLPTANHRGRKPALFLPANHAHLRKLVGLAEGDFPGAVGTAVVDNNGFRIEDWGPESRTGTSCAMTAAIFLPSLWGGSTSDTSTLDSPFAALPPGDRWGTFAMKPLLVHFSIDLSPRVLRQFARYKSWRSRSLSRLRYLWRIRERFCIS